MREYKLEFIPIKPSVAMALTRMVKKLMRLRARSISEAPQAVRDTEWDLYTLDLG